MTSLPIRPSTSPPPNSTGASGSGLTDAELVSWAERLAQDVPEGYEGYAYFNNDAEGYAIRDAQHLRARLPSLAV